jgi:hypothetical protein
MLGTKSLILLTIVLLSVSAISQTSISACGMKCGQERWAIKTLTDSEAAAVGSAAPENTTVTDLLGKTGPAKLTNTRAPLEKERFHLTALIIGWKIEATTSDEIVGKTTAMSTSVPDHDFHIVIADPNNTKNQMIMEVPDPDCQAVCSSTFLKQISQVRSEVSSKLGTPTSSVVALAKPWLVEITGPAFFDFVHGQVGLARNCIEIHPVMEIKFLKQQGDKVTPHKATDLTHECGKE